MKRIFLVAVALLMSAGAASASTKQKWTAGWDNFGEPLDYSKSTVKWAVAASTKKLTVTYALVGAVPSSCTRLTWPFSAPRLPAALANFRFRRS